MNFWGKFIFSVCLFIASAGGALAATLGSGAPLCGYGLYKVNGECVSWSAQSEKCHQINGQNSYFMAVNQATYAGPQQYADAPCDAGYDLISLDRDVMYPIYTGVIAMTGAPLCGYNQYKLNGTCYDWTDEDVRGRCPDGFYKTNINQATYMQYIDGAVCSPGYNELDYGVYLTADNQVIFYPIYNGVIGLSGAPLGTGTSLDTSTACLDSLGARYYKLDLSTYETSIYEYPENGVCPSGYAKLNVYNDCKDININNNNASDRYSVANQGNQFCGILCPSGENSVYSNSGQCTSYCNVGGKNLRLYARRGDKTVSFPLYTGGATVPAVHLDVDGNICHVNLYTGGQGNAINIKYNDITYHTGE